MQSITGTQSATEAPGVLEQQNVTLTGYHDLDGRPGFKLAMQESGGRFYLYVAHLWHNGWSVLDVTDPARPTLENFIAGPANTWTLQVQVAEGRMVTSLEQPAEGWAPVREGYEEGAYIWDVAADPVRPRLLGQYRTGGDGTHRNFYAGGRYMYMAARPEGFTGKIMIAVDIADPAQPREVSRWWWPGQHSAAGETPEFRHYLHGPAYIQGERAYLSYGKVGAIILDIADLAKPRLVSRVSFGDVGSQLGCHTVVPIPERHLLICNSETIFEGKTDPLNYVFVVDIADEAKPKVISFFPTPAPRPGLSYASYYEKGGRFGPHNQAHYQEHPSLMELKRTAVMTWFNAGLRVFDLTDPWMPREVGCFVPADPTERRGLLPRTLVTQFEDVLVDRRGNIFCTEKNYGVFALRTSVELG